MSWNSLILSIFFKNMLNWRRFPPLSGAPVLGSTSRKMLCLSSFGSRPSTMRPYFSSAFKKCGNVPTIGASTKKILSIHSLKSFEWFPYQNIESNQLLPDTNNLDHQSKRLLFYPHRNSQACRWGSCHWLHNGKLEFLGKLIAASNAFERICGGEKVVSGEIVWECLKNMGVFVSLVTKFLDFEHFYVFFLHQNLKNNIFFPRKNLF